MLIRQKDSLDFSKPHAIRTAIRAGVKCIEHGQQMDETSAKFMAENGVWLSLQPFCDSIFRRFVRFKELRPRRTGACQKFADSQS